jgi:hypothetical protein
MKYILSECLNFSSFVVVLLKLFESFKICETWSLTVGEEHALRVFENGVLRRIFGPKKEEVAGRWRKLHNQELHNLFFAKYNYDYKVEEDKVGGTCGTNGREEEHL